MQVEITAQTQKVVNNLNQTKADFIPKLLKDSTDKLEMMKKNMQSLEATTKQYEELLALLKE